MSEHAPAFGAVTLEVLWTRLISIVDEAAKAVTRTAFSTLSNEANDFACVLTDERGHLVAQNTGSIPSFISTLPSTVKHFVREIGVERMKSGDILCTNDPWKGTGHLNDVCVVRPIFRGGRIVAFAASTSHVPDIGGKIRSVEPREIFEEGFHIPPMKIFHEGVPSETFFRVLKAQVRTPEQTVGDIYAQITALDLMDLRLNALMDDYALARVTELSDELNRRCEAAMREAIRGVPNGSYEFEMKTDGLAPNAPFVFRVRLTVADETIHADFTGTSPVQPRAINTCLCYTFAMVAYAVKCALLPEIANCEGVFRPITISVPENSILNPLFPAAVGGRSNTGHYVPAVVFGALAKVLPERVMAAPGSPLWNCTQSGVRPNGKPYANNLFFNGGMGAVRAKDGESTISWPSNISSTPVEVAEQNSPFFFRYKRLRPNSGGDGRHRGGLGQDIYMENESESPIAVIFLAERTRIPAPGLLGGREGGRGDVVIDGTSMDTRHQYVLQKGATLLLRTPGGGGYGPPEERGAAARARDRLLGYVED
ncbi:MAG: hydantoinase B/oxoprolinase family protein [Proteobacteria bacterium]|nr:hydantoinase B/oxoprolinase family protein [Pseudomonadota bacterium]